MQLIYTKLVTGRRLIGLSEPRREGCSHPRFARLFCLPLHLVECSLTRTSLEANMVLTSVVNALAFPRPPRQASADELREHPGLPWLTTADGSTIPAVP